MKFEKLPIESVFITFYGQNIVHTCFIKINKKCKYHFSPYWEIPNIEEVSILGQRILDIKRVRVK